MVDKRQRTETVSGNWLGAFFAALMLFGLVTLVSKVLHAEDTHSQQMADIQHRLSQSKSDNWEAVAQRNGVRGYGSVILQPHRTDNQNHVILDPTSTSGDTRVEEEPEKGKEEMAERNGSGLEDTDTARPDETLPTSHQEISEDIHSEVQTKVSGESAATFQTPSLPSIPPPVQMSDSAQSLSLSEPFSSEDTAKLVESITGSGLEPSSSPGEGKDAITNESDLKSLNPKVLKSVHELYPESLSRQVRTDIASTSSQVRQETLSRVETTKKPTGVEAAPAEGTASTERVEKADPLQAGKQTRSSLDTNVDASLDVAAADKSHPDQWDLADDPSSSPERASWRASVGDNLTRAVKGANHVLQPRRERQPFCYLAPQPWLPFQSEGAPEPEEPVRDRAVQREMTRRSAQNPFKSPLDTAPGNGGSSSSVSLASRLPSSKGGFSLASASSGNSEISGNSGNSGNSRSNSTPNLALMHSQARKYGTGGRRLFGFSSAGRGGKTGMSCARNAPMKAKQACAESRALKRCQLESSAWSGQASEDLSPEEELLASCLREGEASNACQAASRDQLARAANQLKGIQLLMSARPKCVFQHHAGNCSHFEKNQETGLYMGGCGQRGGGPAAGCNMNLNPALPKDDLKRRYHTCAVVGNSMNLFRSKSGKSIDQHDAVFRFNNEAERMLFVLDKAMGMRRENMADHIGKKSTIRLLNRKYTYQMLNHEVGAGDLSNDDFTVFWNYFTVPYLKYLQAQYPSSRLYLLSPDLINWQLAVFSQLRSDLLKLGLGPFECYRFMSSGVHGLLLSMLLCNQVDVYGFSITMDNFKEGFNHGRPSESHSWQFETMLMRLLYYVGAFDVCNT